MGFEANVRKKLWAGVALFAVLAGALVSAQVWHKTLLSSAGLNLNLAAPDALIRSNSLSRLPADLLRVPLLHDLLTEDFLFYYENSEGRLGLSGTLRRISYEHDVTLTDELIRLVMDEPAEVALWRGADGSLKYYAIAMTRNKLAKLLEPAAKIAMKDRQLSMVGELRIEGQMVQLFALEYAWNRKLLLATREDRVLVFSDPGMLLTTSGDLNSNASELLGDLLSGDKNKQRRFSRAFDLDDAASGHSIALKTNFMSFSYQHFFPALKALRFDFSEKPMAGGQGWSTAALLDVDPAHAAGLLDAHVLWISLPHQPSACAVMPVDWLALAKGMNSQTVVKLEADKLAAQFEGPAAVCWYASSRLHTPLFVAQTSKAEGGDAVLEAYFNYSIRGEAQDGKERKKVKAVTSKAGDVIWQGKDDSGEPQATLARSGKLVYFSPDAALVEQALAVAHKRQPALADRWKDSAAASNAVAVLGPEHLAQLGEREITLSLPQQQDAVLRNAADRHLLPKLAAVKKYPPMRLELHDTPKGAGWVALDWQPF